jgi:hypothetical protein
MILDLGNSTTARPLYPRGKNLRYPLDRRLGGPQSRSGRCGVERNPFPGPMGRRWPGGYAIERHNLRVTRRGDLNMDTPTDTMCATSMNVTEQTFTGTFAHGRYVLPIEAFIMLYSQDLQLAQPVDCRLVDTRQSVVVKLPAKQKEQRQI